MIDALRVTPGASVDLRRWATDDRLGLEDKPAGRRITSTRGAELRDLQSRLWAEDRRSVLLVLQGMDTAGKDGTIRRVFASVNPQGVSVASFKKPTEHELDRDYLWRVHKVVPRRGEIRIFNRSHYEDVGVVRVIGLIDEARAEKRFGHINAFEQMLTDEGTTIVKVFLHISKDEQRERLQARVDRPEKHWKFSHGDLESREDWDDYQRVYSDAITATSTDHAPWWIVPADRKWVRDAAISSLLVRTLKEMKPQVPPRDPTLEGLVVE